MVATTTRKRTTKRKRAASKTTRTAAVANSPAPIRVNFAAVGQTHFGWDARITLYVNPKEVVNYTTHKAFTSQIRGPFTAEGYTFTELGAFHDDSGDRRIVEVTGA